MADVGKKRRIRIDLGCGTRKVAGTLGVDTVAVPGVDILADLNSGLPFKDDSIDAVYSYHILEHMDDFLATMGEIWRTCRPGALVYVKVPHSASSFITWKDPTHRRGLSIATFAYFDDTYFDGAAFSYYSKASFRIERAKLNFTLTDRNSELLLSWPRRVVNLMFDVFANRGRRWQYVCERFWGPIVGIEEADLVLRAQKDSDASQRPALVQELRDS